MPNSAIDDAIAEARALLNDPQEGFYPDAFTLISDSSSDDTAGGFTDTGDVVMASGFCKLRSAGSGSERSVAEKLGWQHPYVVDLPVTVIVNPAWRIMIQGRTFEIGGIVKAGNWGVQQSLVVKEHG